MKTKGLDALEFRRGQLVRWSEHPGLFEVFRADTGAPACVVRGGDGLLYVAIKQALRLSTADGRVRSCDEGLLYQRR